MFEDTNALTVAIFTQTDENNFDVNPDGSFDLRDHSHWVQELAIACFGDANLDGVFDSRGFVKVFAVEKYETGELAGWHERDWNGSDRFDSADFVIAFQDGGYEMGVRTDRTTVPETSGWNLKRWACL